jgi:DNA polymerase III subunit gamma/tau
MYQVIARKYRPQSFDDILNQDHIKTTLRNAIAQNRIAHGYIFSGQRGTGKTTTARIIALCLNCERGPTDKPCGVCASCVEIAAGGAVDVIEIDAASNRGINEMRELRENVRYQPARDRYKVFIIDEAHQITNEAFNALLKTIEEPPEWAVFILCTTESHKIPATIASRCQHFSFRSVDFNDLIGRMREICVQEGVETDDETLAVLAQAGEGSVRDSLSALDQAIACCGNKLNAAQVRTLLGAFGLDAMAQVTTALGGANGGAMLSLVDELERNGGSPQHFSRELSRYIRNLLVIKIAGTDSRLVTASPAEKNEMAQIAASFSEEDLTRYLQLSLDLFRDLQFSMQPRFHLEIGLLKMIQAGRLLSIEEALASLSGEVKTPEPAPKRAAANLPPPATPLAATPRKPAVTTAPDTPAVNVGPVNVDPPSPDDDWREKLQSAMIKAGLQFSADAMGQSNAALVNNKLVITASKQFQLDLGRSEISAALKLIGHPALRFEIVFGEEKPPAKPASAPLASAPGTPSSGLAAKDETTERALGHPEVQRYRELFGGDVRNIRNLKES